VQYFLLQFILKLKTRTFHTFFTELLRNWRAIVIMTAILSLLILRVDVGIVVSFCLLPCSIDIFLFFDRIRYLLKIKHIRNVPLLQFFDRYHFVILSLIFNRHSLQETLSCQTNNLQSSMFPNSKLFFCNFHF